MSLVSYSYQSDNMKYEKYIKKKYVCIYLGCMKSAQRLILC